MDEVGIFFEIEKNHSLEIKWKRKFTSGKSKERVTVMVTACSNGTLLPPFFIFNQEQRLTKTFPANEIPALDEDTRKLVKKSGMKVYQNYTAWMNNRVMIKYYLPYYREKTKTIPSLLVLDNCTAHCHNDVIKELNDTKTGVAHLHLAPNTTPICQPVDISIGKSLKSKVRAIRKLARE